jgi:hypothetical protein
MPLKVVVKTLLMEATALGLGGDTNITDNLQPVIRG